MMSISRGLVTGRGAGWRCGWVGRGGHSADPPSGSYTGTIIDGAGIKKRWHGPVALTPCGPIALRSIWGPAVHRTCTCRAMPTPGHGPNKARPVAARSIAARWSLVSVWGQDYRYRADQERLTFRRQRHKTSNRPAISKRMAGRAIKICA